MIAPKPSIITQASVDLAPISRLELEAHRAATAKPIAAPSPPSIAIMQRFQFAEGQSGQYSPTDGAVSSDRGSPGRYQERRRLWQLPARKVGVERPRAVAIGQVDFSSCRFGPERVPAHAGAHLGRRADLRGERIGRDGPRSG